MRRKAQVTLFVEPHGQRVPVSDQEPLAHIKLGAMDQKWTFHVLLHHPLAFLDKSWINIHQPENLIQTLDTFNTFRADTHSHSQPRVVRYYVNCLTMTTSYLCPWTLLQV